MNDILKYTHVYVLIFAGKLGRFLPLLYCIKKSFKYYKMQAVGLGFDGYAVFELLCNLQFSFLDYVSLYPFAFVPSWRFLPPYFSTSV